MMKEDTLTKAMRAMIREELRAVLPGELAGWFEKYSSGGLSAVKTGAEVKPKERSKTADTKRQSPRRAELWKWLKQHGPLERTAIIKQSGIPSGTIATILNEPRGEFKLAKGKWTAEDQQPTSASG